MSQNMTVMWRRWISPAMAFVAFDEVTNEMVGVVRIHSDSIYESGEYAILLRSDLKGKGLGWVLMQLIIEYARSEGLKIISGDVLRDWLAMDRDSFYDTSRIAIVPAGLCYPGTVDGADLPPRPRCAPLWQPRFHAALPGIRLTLLVGSYAQAYYLPRRKKTLGETVRAYREYLPQFFPLPHPSWRNLLWRRKNPWFESEVLPELRHRIQGLKA